MKQTEKFPLRVLSGMVALGIVMAVARAGAESVPQVVQVVKVEGNAQYSVDGRTWQTLHLGDVLKPGAVIRTAEKSLVDVTLGEEGSTGGTSAGPYLMNMPGGAGGGAGAGAGGGGGSPDTETANVIRIFQSTVLGVDKLTLDRTGVDEVSETQLDLRAGQIMGNVKKLSAQSRYEIKVPNGVAGIRGAAWGISVSTLQMYSGIGRFAGPDANSVLKVSDVHAHQKLDFSTGQVSPISDSVFAQDMDIFNSMCSSAGGGQPGPATAGQPDNSCISSCNTFPLQSFYTPSLGRIVYH
jgi:hypothetical protein